MKENDWTESICKKLSPFLKKHSLEANTLQKIPYAQEINCYKKDWDIDQDDMTTTAFETDLVIYERTDEKIIPRVIIEAKIGNVTTHDAITYSYKAEKHKTITPYLRYGIMLGDRKEYPLPGRLYRHGTNFDFMFSFTGTDPEEYEWDTFTKMITDEVKYSRIIEEMLHENRSKNRNRYYMLQKKLIVKEIES